jgi:hypothetical protein
MQSQNRRKPTDDVGRITLCLSSLRKGYNRIWVYRLLKADILKYLWKFVHVIYQSVQVVLRWKPMPGFIIQYGWHICNQGECRSRGAAGPIILSMWDGGLWENPFFGEKTTPFENPSDATGLHHANFFNSNISWWFTNAFIAIIYKIWRHG